MPEKTYSCRENYILINKKNLKMGLLSIYARDG